MEEKGRRNEVVERIFSKVLGAHMRLVKRNMISKYDLRYPRSIPSSCNTNGWMWIRGGGGEGYRVNRCWTEKRRRREVSPLWKGAKYWFSRISLSGAVQRTVGEQCSSVDGTRDELGIKSW